MIEKLLKNHQAFSNMLFATTLLSNVYSQTFEADSNKIIDFIGKAFHLDQQTIKAAQKLITDDLMTISVKDDVTAFTNAHDYDSKLQELDPFLSMKCDAINIVESLANKASFHINSAWFDYGHYKPYYPEVRFAQLNTVATIGHPIANKVVGLMCFLGIGCEKNVDSAILRMKQCALWGDTACIFLLREMYDESGDKENAKVFSELESLTDYIKEGRTLIPDKESGKLDGKTKEFFAYISSIKQDVVLNEQRYFIDYSFVEVVLLPKLDYYKKMGYINFYRDQKWKDVTNSSLNPESTKFGFKVGD